MGSRRGAMRAQGADQIHRGVDKGMIPTPLYFESHVTIDPVVEETRLQEFGEICTQHKFRPAKLFMQKGKDFVPSNLDQFCTRRDPVRMGAGQDEIRLRYNEAFIGTHDLVLALTSAGFKVRRHKVEATLTDSKMPTFDG